MADERIVELDQYEYGCVFATMNEKRNDLLAVGENADFVEDILLKLAEAPCKKQSRRKGRSYEAER